MLYPTNARAPKAERAIFKLRPSKRNTPERGQTLTAIYARIDDDLAER